MRRNEGTRSEQHRLERVEVSAALPADCVNCPATAADLRKPPHTSGCGGTWDRLSKDASQDVRALNHDMGKCGDRRKYQLFRNDEQPDIFLFQLPNPLLQESDENRVRTGWSAPQN